MATQAEDLPVTDLAATFVLWADSGFPKEPVTLKEQIAFVKGPESYDEFMEEKKRLERDSMRRAENRRRAARLEAITRHQEEEESRLLQEAADQFRICPLYTFDAADEGHRITPEQPL